MIGKLAKFQCKVNNKLEIDLKKWHNIAGKTGEKYG